MYDVFYFGTKPNLFEFEKYAESIDAAAGMSKTGFYWYIYGGNDYSNFDFEWRPYPWESAHLHVFPSQHQRTGGVYFANVDTVKNRQWNFQTCQSVTRLPDKDIWIVPDNIDDSEFDYSWHPDTTEEPYEYHFPTQWQRAGGPVYPGTAGKKFMTSQKIRAGATQIYYMDFLNPESDRQFQVLQGYYPDIKRTRYVDNHLNVFQRIMSTATTEFVWIISSISDYTKFDFTWHPSEEQREMVHCFPTITQPRGDTFYIHVPSFTQQMVDLELLDWFNVINYCHDQVVDRFETPKHYYETDDLITEIKNHEFRTPYVLFTNQKDHTIRGWPCLWTKKDRAVERFSRSGATVLVPRDVKEDLTTQLYDYPYHNIATRQINEYYGEKLFPGLDIVYISNGEPDEERWYNNLCYMSNTTAKWIRGVNGRVAAYQAAARASTTPWFFAVFAKLEVVPDFPWMEWAPDYWQGPKHYIFNARNPVNGLEYGHMGVIAYNKRLVLANNDPGIDFTLSQPHESVPILSGVAQFNQDAWVTWRTAFREVLKLRLSMDTQPTLETEHRLNTWCTHAVGNYSNYCLDGASDAVAYYKEVGGDTAKLQLSFDWAWLRARYDAKY